MDEPKNNHTLQQTFAALKHRNFRLFWTGQAVSLIGTWMQNVAQSWLVLELTKSAFWLGVVSALQFLPMLVFSLFAGTLVDRLPKQKMLIFTQTFSAILAFTLALDVQFHTVVLWHVLVIATLLGMTNTLDMPTRQAFMIELVGKQDLMNAIILNSSIFNAARILGPSVAGFVIAKLGMGLCFYLNAFSFIPVIGGIIMIRFVNRPSIISPQERPGVLPEIKEGLRYVYRTPVIFAAVLLMAVINIFALNFNVLIPLYARNVFKIGAQGFGLLMAANGIGAVVGSIILAAGSYRRTPKVGTLVVASSALCVFELLLVPVKSHLLAYLLLSLVGFSMIAYTTTTNSLIQVHSPDNLRGRVMSIYTLVFSGFTPFGSFLSGWAANLWGAPPAMGLGAIISLLFIGMMVFWSPEAFKRSS
ncbi:MAG: MFS transporter [Bacillota bacterium]